MSKNFEPRQVTVGLGSSWALRRASPGTGELRELLELSPAPAAPVNRAGPPNMSRRRFEALMPRSQHISTILNSINSINIIVTYSNIYIV